MKFLLRKSQSDGLGLKFRFDFRIKNFINLYISKLCSTMVITAAGLSVTLSSDHFSFIEYVTINVLILAYNEENNVLICLMFKIFDKV